MRTVFTRSSKFTLHMTKTGTGPSGMAASEHNWYTAQSWFQSRTVAFRTFFRCFLVTVYFASDSTAECPTVMPYIYTFIICMLQSN